jgi:hypothetical protein
VTNDEEIVGSCILVIGGIIVCIVIMFVFWYFGIWWSPGPVEPQQVEQLQPLPMATIVPGETRIILDVDHWRKAAPPNCWLSGFAFNGLDVTELRYDCVKE